MRHFTAALLAPALALLACSASPPDPGATSDERPATTTEAVAGSCPAGQTMQCTNETANGKKTCACVPVPCYESIAPPTTDREYVRAWAVPGTSCPEITAYGNRAYLGTWAPYGTIVGSVPVPSDFDGIPTEWGPSGRPLPPPSCQQVLGDVPCCTYVWWPAGYPSAAPSTMPAMQPQALCSATVSTIVAIEQPEGCEADASPECTTPGGHGCTKCQPVPVPP